MMKRRIQIIGEQSSCNHKPIQYALVAPPPAFVHTDILTVFPDLKELVDADKAAAAFESPAAETRATIDEATEAKSESPVTTQPSTPSTASPTLAQPLGPYLLVTFQPCDIEGLVAFNIESADFKDISRDRFLECMRDVEKRLGINRADKKCISKWFVDYPDPATGVPVHTHATSTVFCESDAIEQLFKMELMYVNGCRMVVHPRFKENVYPASAVVYGGSAEELKALLEGL